jgi:hypothetical protein
MIVKGKFMKIFAHAILSAVMFASMPVFAAIRVK